MKEAYRFLLNCNPESAHKKNMRIRLPTAPMFLKDNYELNKCIYRLNRYILESADTQLDEHTLVIELNVPSQNCYTSTLTQGGSNAVADATSSGMVSFLTEITGDTDSCKYYNRMIENGVVGNSMWGNELQLTFYRIALGTGAKTIWTADQDILLELEIEPICEC